jgi:ATP-dependent helicase/nuclease subunit B
MTSPWPILEGAMQTRLVIGRDMTGETLAEVDGAGGLGRPAWDPPRLLADLELRLAIAPARVAPVARIQAFSARMSAIASDRFYTASYRRDPIGTAAALLDWRDELVAAGWEGEMIADGGARLAALAELEALAEPALPPGGADRLRGVERELWRTAIASTMPSRWPTN